MESLRLTLPTFRSSERTPTVFLLLITMLLFCSSCATAPPPAEVRLSAGPAETREDAQDPCRSFRASAKEGSLGILSDLNTKFALFYDLALPRNSKEYEALNRMALLLLETWEIREAPKNVEKKEMKVKIKGSTPREVPTGDSTSHLLQDGPVVLPTSPAAFPLALSCYPIQILPSPTEELLENDLAKIRSKKGPTLKPLVKRQAVCYLPYRLLYSPAKIYYRTHNPPKSTFLTSFPPKGLQLPQVSSQGERVSELKESPVQAPDTQLTLTLLQARECGGSVIWQPEK